MTIQTPRRGFLKGLGVSALVIGISPTGVIANLSSQIGLFSEFVKVSPDGKVTAVLKHFEMGQGTSTGLTTLIAEELGADLDQVAIEFAPADAKLYANLAFGTLQGTGGSTAIYNSFMQYRRAGAAAREMLIQAAADAWGVDKRDLSVQRGIVRGADRSAPISEFVSIAAELEAPSEPRLKDPAEFTLIGNPDTSRRDNEPKIFGTATFAMDIQLENQIVALIKRSPRFGGKLISMDASSAKSVPGFIDAVSLPTGAGVIVYGRNTWAAIRSREAVTAEWDFSAAENRSSDEIKASLMAAVQDDPEFIATSGANHEATQSLIDGSFRVVEKIFYFPYLAHAMMEPLNCTIEPTEDGGIILHDGCQFTTTVHSALSTVLDLPRDQIKIRTLYAGGSFGRRATMSADYQVEAGFAFALTDRKKPVKLMWTREDDLTGGFYRPAYAHKVRVGLNNRGEIIAWDHRIAGQSLFKNSIFEAFMVKDGVDHSSVEGVADTPYSIPNLFVGLTDEKSPITVNWLRSVGNTHTAFVIESMMDMAAKTAEMDPIRFRMRHLAGDKPGQKRMIGVLKLAAEKSGWDHAALKGQSRGIAVHFSFRSFVAEVVEISRNDEGAVAIEKVTCAVDCGLPVNPDIIKAQMEGSIGYGLGLAMRNEITFVDGEVVQQNFPDYEPLHINDIAAIETHIVASREDPTGVGEPGFPPAAPALANAIAVDGPRITELPMTNNRIEFA